MQKRAVRLRHARRQVACYAPDAGGTHGTRRGTGRTGRVGGVARDLATGVTEPHCTLLHKPLICAHQIVRGRHQVKKCAVLVATVMVGVVLAGCSSGTSSSSSSSTSATTKSTSAPSSGTSGGSGNSGNSGTSGNSGQGSGGDLAPQSSTQGMFQSPTGNIICTMDSNNPSSGGMGSQSGVNCSTLNPPDHGATLDLGNNGVTVCSSQCSGGPQSGLPTLAYGSAMHVGPYSCNSATSGVTCEGPGGVGFTISRSGVEKLG